ncbi:hypothetical protein [Staphylococcus warneri]|uniref:hypothetical protein n=1 Tax=Staphylococcus warneri TaxID=1292 RepID=UPI00326107BD
MLSEINKILNDTETLYFKLKEDYELAINKDMYVIEKNGNINYGRIKDTNIDIDKIVQDVSEAQKIIDANEVAEILGMTKQNVNKSMRNHFYERIPKPLFYYENKSYTKYFWLRSQF